MTIGVRLKEERSRLGLNQTDIAAAGGVGKTTQINYEKGAGAPDAFYLAAVERLGVDVLYVVTGTRKPAAADAISAEDLELLRLFNQLEEDDRVHISRTISALAYMPAQKVVNGDK